MRGEKYSINRQYVIYNTFSEYFILYNKLSDCFYISTYDSNDREKVDKIRNCTEDYVYADKCVYLIDSNKIEKSIEKIKYTINIGNDKLYMYNIDSVYSYYLIK